MPFCPECGGQVLGRSGSAVFVVGDLEIRPRERRAIRHSSCVPEAFIWFTRIEFDLVTILAAAYPDAVSIEQIEDDVWGGRDISENLLSQHLRNVRVKLRDAKSITCVKNVRGYGYRLDLEDQ